MFNRKSKQIDELLDEIYKLNKQLYSSQKENYNDFILILEKIQETNKEPMHWRRRQAVIDNQINLTIENYRDKILELDINV